MDDLRQRFTEFDRVPMPDLWSSIERRAERLATTATVEGGRIRATAPVGLWSRPIWLWLVLLALLAAMVVGVAGQVLRLDQLPAIVVPSATPDASTPPATDPVASCDAPPVNEIRSTPIAIAEHPAEIVFVDCSGWVNDGRITRVDLGTNEVIATIVPDEIVRSIDADDGVVFAVVHPSAIEGGAGVRLVRIDPATDAAIDIAALPHTGQLAMLGTRAYVRNPVRGTTVFLPLDADRTGLTPNGSAITVPDQGAFLGSEAGAIWLQAGTSGILRRFSPDAEADISIDVGDSWVCALGGIGVACGSEDGVVRFVPSGSDAIAWTTAIEPWTGDAVYVAVLDDSIWVMPETVEPGPGDPTELIEIDAATGDVLRRIDWPVRRPLAMWAGAGSLWLSSAADPLVRLDIPPNE